MTSSRAFASWWAGAEALALGLFAVLVTLSSNAAASGSRESQVAMDGEPGACNSIVVDIKSRRQADAFAQAGLAPGPLPAAYTEGLTATSITCLADDLAGVVTAVFVEFKDKDGRFTAVWLSANPDGPRQTDWSGYLHETYRDTTLEIETNGNSVVGLPPTHKRDELRDAVRANDSSGLTLWQALLRDLPTASG